MIVCLDSGNSRLKWGVHDGRAWREQGACAQAEVAGSEALAALAQRWPAPSRVLLANVAGTAAGAAIRQALAPWAAVFREVVSTAAAGGVRNLYDVPARLGVDRWCALVGARRLHPAAALVVMAGTATTVDSLDGDGDFLGGLILPGLDLMQRALARDTAGLPLAAGRYAPWPRCTGDAIVSGCLEAQAGAIERAFARLPGADALCLLSGGNAEVLGGLLAAPHRIVPNLPLEGLRRLAEDA